MHASAGEAYGQPLSVTVHSLVSGTAGPTQEVTHYRYDPRGTLHSAADARGYQLGYQSTTTYNIVDQPLTSTAPIAGTGSTPTTATSTYAYPGGPATTVTLTDEAGATLRSTTTTYGNEGEVLQVSGSTEPVAYTYDALYRVTSVKDGKGIASGKATNYYYCTQRNLLSAVTLPGFSGTAPYQAAGSEQWTVSGKDSASLTYDASLYLLTSRTDGNARTTYYGYDSTVDNRLNQVFYHNPASNATPDIALAFDDFGRVSQVTDTTATHTTTFDDLDLPRSQTTAYVNGSTPLTAWTENYLYNLDGSRQSLTLVNGTSGASYAFGYGYDDLGRPKSVSNPYGQTFGWNYYSTGGTTPLATDLVTEQTASKTGNIGLYDTTYAYDKRGFLTDQRTVNGAATPAVLAEYGSTGSSGAMTYDGAGNRLALPVSMPTVNSVAGYGGATYYTYDGTSNTNGTTNPNIGRRGQLTQEATARGGNAVLNFDYDPSGNPTTFRSTGGIGYNANNQNSSASYTYDGNGNPTAYPLGTGSAPATYDYENRLTALTVTTASGTQPITYGYRADGLRAWKFVQETFSQNAAGKGGQSGASSIVIGPAPAVMGLTYYLYDGGSVIAELDSTGALTRLNTWGATGLLARQDAVGGGSSVYVFDPAGNVARRLDGNGVVKGSYAFDAWGAKRASNDTTSNNDPYCGYGGQWGYYTDAESGLTLCGHRYYDSNTGRWLTRDPIGYAGGINLYGYVGNNASNGIDPNGTDIVLGGGTLIQNDPRILQRNLTLLGHVWTSQNSLIGLLYGLGGHYSYDSCHETIKVTGGVGNWIFGGNYGAITFGDVVLSRKRITNSTYQHELVHVQQGRYMGPLYIASTILSYGVGFLRGYGHDASPMEIDADIRSGCDINTIGSPSDSSRGNQFLKDYHYNPASSSEWPYLIM